MNQRGLGTLQSANSRRRSNLKRTLGLAASAYIGIVPVMPLFPEELIFSDEHFKEAERFLALSPEEQDAQIEEGLEELEEELARDREARAQENI